MKLENIIEIVGSIVFLGIVFALFYVAMWVCY